MPRRSLALLVLLALLATHSLSAGDAELLVHATAWVDQLDRTVQSLGYSVPPVQVVVNDRRGSVYFPHGNTIRTPPFRHADQSYLSLIAGSHDEAASCHRLISNVFGTAHEYAHHLQSTAGVMASMTPSAREISANGVAVALIRLQPDGEVILQELSATLTAALRQSSYQPDTEQSVQAYFESAYHRVVSEYEHYMYFQSLMILYAIHTCDTEWLQTHLNTMFSSPDTFVVDANAARVDLGEYDPCR